MRGSYWRDQKEKEEKWQYLTTRRKGPRIQKERIKVMESFQVAQLMERQKRGHVQA